MNIPMTGAQILQYNLASRAKQTDHSFKIQKLSTRRWEANVQSESKTGTSLVVQWLGLHAPDAGGPGSTPGWGTRSHMHAATKSPQATTEKSACRN